MSKLRRIYKEPVETARHRQLKQLCLDYFTNYDKLMKHPSRRYALRARRALMKLVRVSRERGREILNLYSDYQNQGKEPLYGTNNNNRFRIDRNEEKEDG